MKTINELQVCFFISVIAHIGLVGAGVFDFALVKPEKPFEVDFNIEEEVLPEQYEIQEEKKIENPILEKEEIIEPVEQETIEPEEVDEEFKKSLLRYQDTIKQKIQEEKRYPRWALRIGHEGITQIVFNVLSSGRVDDLRLKQSSGFEELDKEALDAVRRASPFLSFPEKLNENEIQVEIDIIFRISFKK